MKTWDMLRRGIGSLAAIAALLLYVVGCATVPHDDASESAPYRIRPGDVLAIEVYQEPDISKPFQVSREGTINHPFLGHVPVSGLTTTEAARRLRGMLAQEFIVNPRVDVTLASSTGRPVMLFGEVRKPGAYEIPAERRFTLLQAIAEAGGFTDIAARDRVRITRRENGRERTLRVRVTDLFRGKDGVTDIDLKPGDVVTIPETLF